FAAMLNSSENWDPSDYILQRKHCPKSVIKATLESIRQAAGAGKLLHIAFDDHDIIGSLCFVTGYPVKIAEELEKQLARVSYEDSSRDLVALGVAASQETIKDSMLLSDKLIRELSLA